MTAQTPQQRLAAEMDEVAGRVHAAIAGLAEEQASRRAPDGWSVKDQLTHLTFWHELRFFEVSRIARGGRASFPVTDEKGVQHINEQIAANRRALTLEQVVADLDFARETVKQAVLSAPEDRVDPSLFEEIGPHGAEHESAHAELIERWRKQEGL